MLTFSFRRNPVYQRWVVYPVVALLLSLMTAWGGLLLFPVFLTVAQCRILNKYTAIARPSLWFIALPLTAFIWYRAGR